MDFRDIKKASPKDDFPLVHIDLLVDNTIGNHLLSSTGRLGLLSTFLSLNKSSRLLSFFHLAWIKLLDLNLDIWNPTLYGRHPKYSMTSLALGYINIKTSILPSIKFLVPLPGELAFFNIGVCLSIRGWAF